MLSHNEPSQGVELTGTDSVSDEAPVAEERAGSDPAGVISLQTRFWAMALLLLLSRTRVELDGERHKLPWGQLRVPVVAGRHKLRVSLRYLGRDIGAATKDFDVRGGHTVELSYQAPWLVFRPGKLRLRGEGPLTAQEMPSGLAGSAPSLAATPGWYRDPSNSRQRRWWDGERWTPAIFRPQSTAWKAWVVALGVVTLIVGLYLGGAIGTALRGGSDGSATLTESAEWVTVTEIDGVSFEMPIQPRHSTESIPGTDVTIDMYDVYYDNMAMSAFGVAADIPGDTRTDAQKLRDAADGTADGIDGTVVFSRPTVVDGEPGLDYEVTTPRDGETTVLARVVLADDLLVGVQTVLYRDDLTVAAEAHNRMSRSIRFEG